MIHLLAEVYRSYCLPSPLTFLLIDGLPLRPFLCIFKGGCFCFYVGYHRANTVLTCFLFFSNQIKTKEDLTIKSHCSYIMWVYNVTFYLTIPQLMNNRHLGGFFVVCFFQLPPHTHTVKYNAVFKSLYLPPCAYVFTISLGQIGSQKYSCRVKMMCAPKMLITLPDYPPDCWACTYSSGSQLLFIV